MTLIVHNRKELEQELILRHRDGWSIRALARTFRLARNTVRGIVRGHETQRGSSHNVLPIQGDRQSKLDPFKPQIQQLLEKYPRITGIRILEELRPCGYSGGITILREYLHQHRALRREPVIRFETEPGRQSQMDWGVYTIRFAHGGKSNVLCFSYILGFSRRHYIDFTLHRDFYTLMRRHQDAFAHFGGVASECLYDNEKTVVLRWEAGRPVFNPAFTAFITHYNCRPIACRPRSPQTKGKIEAPFKYVEGNLLCGRDFQDLADLRATARWWLSEKSDRHRHDTTRRPPIELFLEQEQAALQPLPAFPYDSSEVALALCHSDGFVAFETNRYSVPSGHVADILSIKATEYEVLLYGPELQLLARHERQPSGQGKIIEDPSHHRSKRDRYGLEPIRAAFLALGDSAEEFLAGLIEKYPKNCGFHARFILALKEHYQSEDIREALIHALSYQAFDGKQIERILGAQATPRTLESVRNDRARQALAQTLPTVSQRPLTEYGELFASQENPADDHDSRHSRQDQSSFGNPQTAEDPGHPRSGTGVGGTTPTSTD